MANNKSGLEKKLSIDIALPHAAWLVHIPSIERSARRWVRSTLSAANFKIPVQLGLVLANDKALQKLNATWRGQNKPTNVLAFANFTARQIATLRRAGKLAPAAHLGDVVISLQTVKREAKIQKKPIIDHACHMVVHGVLHLLGHDHQNLAQAGRMENLERAILAKFGISDPYAYNAASDGAGYE